MKASRTFNARAPDCQSDNLCARLIVISAAKPIDVRLGEAFGNILKLKLANRHLLGNRLARLCSIVHRTINLPK